MLAEETSQEIKHAMSDATINTGGVMKRLGCNCLKKRSPHVKTLPPHAEQSLHTPKRYLRMQSRVSARREGTSACGEGSPACGAISPHAENIRPHAEMALRTRRTYVRMRSWPSACGNERRAENCTSRLPYETYDVIAVKLFQNV